MENLFSQDERRQIGRLVMEKFKASGFASQSNFAKSIGFKPADLTNIKGEKWLENPQLLSNEKWIRLAREVSFTRNENLRWVIANTYVFDFIQEQLKVYQAYSFAGIFCDDAGIGKTVACKDYADKKPYAFYLDCSKIKTRNRLIKALARAVGIDGEGKYDDILENVIYALELMPNPILIFDEAGDLDDRSTLEIKRIYNSLEGKCAFYLIAADGLKAKIERGIAHKKVGFTEVFSRFGKRFSKVMPSTREEKIEMMQSMALNVLVANGIEDRKEVKTMLMQIKNDGVRDLRSIYREVIKLRAKNEAA